MRGDLILTDDGLLHYWQQERVNCLNRSRILEDTLNRRTRDGER
ncbi:MAG: hypothetical protein QM677_06880 [Microbacterium sp.]